MEVSQQQAQLEQRVLHRVEALETWAKDVLTDNAVSRGKVWEEIKKQLHTSSSGTKSQDVLLALRRPRNAAPQLGIGGRGAGQATASVMLYGGSNGETNGFHLLKSILTSLKNDLENTKRKTFRSEGVELFGILVKKLFEGADQLAEAGRRPVVDAGGLASPSKNRTQDRREELANARRAPPSVLPAAVIEKEVLKHLGDGSSSTDAVVYELFSILSDETIPAFTKERANITLDFSQQAGPLLTGIAKLTTLLFFLPQPGETAASSSPSEGDFPYAAFSDILIRLLKAFHEQPRDMSRARQAQLKANANFLPGATHQLNSSSNSNSKSEKALKCEQVQVISANLIKYYPGEFSPQTVRNLILYPWFRQSREAFTMLLLRYPYTFRLLVDTQNETALTSPIEYATKHLLEHDGMVKLTMRVDEQAKLLRLCCVLVAMEAHQRYERPSGRSAGGDMMLSWQSSSRTRHKIDALRRQLVQRTDKSPDLVMAVLFVDWLFPPKPPPATSASGPAGNAHVGGSFVQGSKVKMLENESQHDGASQKSNGLNLGLRDGVWTKTRSSQVACSQQGSCEGRAPDYNDLLSLPPGHRLAADLRVKENFLKSIPMAVVENLLVHDPDFFSEEMAYNFLYKSCVPRDQAANVVVMRALGGALQAGAGGDRRKNSQLLNAAASAPSFMDMMLCNKPHTPGAGNKSSAGGAEEDDSILLPIEKRMRRLQSFTNVDFYTEQLVESDVQPGAGPAAGESMPMPPSCGARTPPRRLWWRGDAFWGRLVEIVRAPLKHGGTLSASHIRKSGALLRYLRENADSILSGRGGGGRSRGGASSGTGTGSESESSVSTNDDKHVLPIAKFLLLARHFVSEDQFLLSRVRRFFFTTPAEQLHDEYFLFFEEFAACGPTAVGNGTISEEAHQYYGNRNDNAALMGAPTPNEARRERGKGKAVMSTGQLSKLCLLDCDEVMRYFHRAVASRDRCSPLIMRLYALAAAKRVKVLSAGEKTFPNNLPNSSSPSLRVEFASDESGIGTAADERRRVQSLMMQALYPQPAGPVAAPITANAFSLYPYKKKHFLLPLAFAILRPTAAAAGGAAGGSAVNKMTLSPTSSVSTSPAAAHLWAPFLGLITHFLKMEARHHSRGCQHQLFENCEDEDYVSLLERKKIQLEKPTLFVSRNLGEAGDQDQHGMDLDAEEFLSAMQTPAAELHLHFNSAGMDDGSLARAGDPFGSSRGGTSRAGNDNERAKLLSQIRLSSIKSKNANASACPTGVRHAASKKRNFGAEFFGEGSVSCFGQKQNINNKRRASSAETPTRRGAGAQTDYVEDSEYATTVNIDVPTVSQLLADSKGALLEWAQAMQLAFITTGDVGEDVVAFANSQRGGQPAGASNSSGARAGAGVADLDTNLHDDLEFANGDQHETTSASSKRRAGGVRAKQRSKNKNDQSHQSLGLALDEDDDLMGDSPPPGAGGGLFSEAGGGGGLSSQGGLGQHHHYQPRGCDIDDFPQLINQAGTSAAGDGAGAGLIRLDAANMPAFLTFCEFVLTVDLAMDVFTRKLLRSGTSSFSHDTSAVPVFNMNADPTLQVDEWRDLCKIVLDEFVMPILKGGHGHDESGLGGEHSRNGGNSCHHLHQELRVQASTRLMPLVMRIQARDSEEGTAEKRGNQIVSGEEPPPLPLDEQIVTVLPWPVCSVEEEGTEKKAGAIWQDRSNPLIWTVLLQLILHSSTKTNMAQRLRYLAAALIVAEEFQQWSRFYELCAQVTDAVGEGWLDARYVIELYTYWHAVSVDRKGFPFEEVFSICGTKTTDSSCPRGRPDLEMYVAKYLCLYNDPNIVGKSLLELRADADMMLNTVGLEQEQDTAVTRETLQRRRLVERVAVLSCGRRVEEVFQGLLAGGWAATGKVRVGGSPTAGSSSSSAGPSLLQHSLGAPFEQSFSSLSSSMAAAKNQELLKRQLKKPPPFSAEELLGRYIAAALSVVTPLGFGKELRGLQPPLIARKDEGGQRETSSKVDLLRKRCDNFFGSLREGQGQSLYVKHVLNQFDPIAVRPFFWAWYFKLKLFCQRSPGDLDEIPPVSCVFVGEESSGEAEEKAGGEENDEGKQNASENLQSSAAFGGGAVSSKRRLSSPVRGLAAKAQAKKRKKCGDGVGGVSAGGGDGGGAEGVGNHDTPRKHLPPGTRPDEALVAHDFIAVLPFVLQLLQTPQALGQDDRSVAVKTAKQKFAPLLISNHAKREDVATWRQMLLTDFRLLVELLEPVFMSPKLPLYSDHARLVDRCCGLLTKTVVRTEEPAMRALVGMLYRTDLLRGGTSGCAGVEGGRKLKKMLPSLHAIIRDKPEAFLQPTGICLRNPTKVANLTMETAQAAQRQLANYVQRADLNGATGVTASAQWALLRRFRDTLPHAGKVLESMQLSDPSTDTFWQYTSVLGLCAANAGDYDYCKYLPESGGTAKSLLPHLGEGWYFTDVGAGGGGSGDLRDDKKVEAPKREREGLKGELHQDSDQPSGKRRKLSLDQFGNTMSQSVNVVDPVQQGLLNLSHQSSASSGSGVAGAKENGTRRRSTRDEGSDPQAQAGPGIETEKDEADVSVTVANFTRPSCRTLLEYARREGNVNFLRFVEDADWTGLVVGGKAKEDCGGVHDDDSGSTGTRSYLDFLTGDWTDANTRVRSGEHDNGVDVGPRDTAGNFAGSNLEDALWDPAFLLSLDITMKELGMNYRERLDIGSPYPPAAHPHGGGPGSFGALDGSALGRRRILIFAVLRLQQLIAHPNRTLRLLSMQIMSQLQAAAGPGADAAGVGEDDGAGDVRKETAAGVDAAATAAKQATRTFPSAFAEVELYLNETLLRNTRSDPLLVVGGGSAADHDPGLPVTPYLHALAQWVPEERALVQKAAEALVSSTVAPVFEEQAAAGSAAAATSAAEEAAKVALEKSGERLESFLVPEEMKIEKLPASSILSGETPTDGQSASSQKKQHRVTVVCKFLDRRTVAPVWRKSIPSLFANDFSIGTAVEGVVRAAGVGDFFSKTPEFAVANQSTPTSTCSFEARCIGVVLQRHHMLEDGETDSAKNGGAGDQQNPTASGSFEPSIRGGSSDNSLNLNDLQRLWGGRPRGFDDGLFDSAACSSSYERDSHWTQWSNSASDFSYLPGPLAGASTKKTAARNEPGLLSMWLDFLHPQFLRAIGFRFDTFLQLFVCSALKAIGKESLPANEEVVRDNYMGIARPGPRVDVLSGASECALLALHDVVFARAAFSYVFASCGHAWNAILKRLTELAKASRTAEDFGPQLSHFSTALTNLVLLSVKRVRQMASKIDNREKPEDEPDSVTALLDSPWFFNFLSSTTPNNFESGGRQGNFLDYLSLAELCLFVDDAATAHWYLEFELQVLTRKRQLNAAFVGVKKYTVDMELARAGQLRERSPHEEEQKRMRESAELRAKIDAYLGETQLRRTELYTEIKSRLGNPLDHLQVAGWGMTNGTGRGATREPSAYLDEDDGENADDGDGSLFGERPGSSSTAAAGRGTNMKMHCPATETSSVAALVATRNMVVEKSSGHLSQRLILAPFSAAARARALDDRRIGPNTRLWMSVYREQVDKALRGARMESLCGGLPLIYGGGRGAPLLLQLQNGHADAYSFSSPAPAGAAGAEDATFLEEAAKALVHLGQWETDGNASARELRTEGTTSGTTQSQQLNNSIGTGPSQQGDLLRGSSSSSQPVAFSPAQPPTASGSNASASTTCRVVGLQTAVAAALRHSSEDYVSVGLNFVQHDLLGKGRFVNAAVDAQILADVRRAISRTSTPSAYAQYVLQDSAAVLHVASASHQKISADAGGRDGRGAAAAKGNSNASSLASDNMVISPSCSSGAASSANGITGAEASARRNPVGGASVPVVRSSNKYSVDLYAIGALEPLLAVRSAILLRKVGEMQRSSPGASAASLHGLFGSVSEYAVNPRDDRATQLAQKQRQPLAVLRTFYEASLVNSIAYAKLLRQVRGQCEKACQVLADGVSREYEAGLSSVHQQSGQMRPPAVLPNHAYLKQVAQAVTLTSNRNANYTATSTSHGQHGASATSRAKNEIQASLSFPIHDLSRIFLLKQQRDYQIAACWWESGGPDRDRAVKVLEQVRKELDAAARISVNSGEDSLYRQQPNNLAGATFGFTSSPYSPGGARFDMFHAKVLSRLGAWTHKIGRQIEGSKLLEEATKDALHAIQHRSATATSSRATAAAPERQFLYLKPFLQYAQVLDDMLKASEETADEKRKLKEMAAAANKKNQNSMRKELENAKAFDKKQVEYLTATASALCRCLSLFDDGYAGKRLMHGYHVAGEGGCAGDGLASGTADTSEGPSAGTTNTSTNTSSQLISVSASGRAKWLLRLNLITSRLLVIWFNNPDVVTPILDSSLRKDGLKLKPLVSFLRQIASRVSLLHKDPSPPPVVQPNKPAAPRPPRVVLKKGPGAATGAAALDPPSSASSSSARGGSLPTDGARKPDRKGEHRENLSRNAVFQNLVHEILVRMVVNYPFEALPVLLPLMYADTYVASDQYLRQLGPTGTNPEKKPEAARVILDEAKKRALLWVRGLAAAEGGQNSLLWFAKHDASSLDGSTGVSAGERARRDRKMADVLESMRNGGSGTGAQRYGDRFVSLLRDVQKSCFSDPRNCGHFFLYAPSTAQTRGTSEDEFRQPSKYKAFYGDKRMKAEQIATTSLHERIDAMEAVWNWYVQCTAPQPGDCKDNKLKIQRVNDDFHGVMGGNQIQRKVIPKPVHDAAKRACKILPPITAHSDVHYEFTPGDLTAHWPDFYNYVGSGISNPRIFTLTTVAGKVCKHLVKGNDDPRQDYIDQQSVVRGRPLLKVILSYLDVVAPARICRETQESSRSLWA
eukprot:g697.t1